MKKTIVVCDVTGEDGAFTIRRYTGRTEFNGVENEHDYEEADISPEILISRLNAWLCERHDEHREQLWKKITKCKKTVD